MTRQSNKGPADAAYKTAHSKATANIKKLSKVLVDHAKKQTSEPMNWGYVGDIGYINEQLEVLLKSFHAL